MKNPQNLIVKTNNLAFLHMFLCKLSVGRKGMMKTAVTSKI